LTCGGQHVVRGGRRAALLPGRGLPNDLEMQVNEYMRFC
jgi:hypothetical protein